MRNVVVSLSLIFAAALVVFADEKPTKEYQDMMKSNQATVGPMGLRGHIAMKDYDAIGRDAATIKENYTKLEAFWTQKKADDAVAIVKTGLQAAMDLDAGAKAKDDEKIVLANRALAGTCTDCHQDHRTQLVPAKNGFEIR
jgi:hypothetical protein